MLVAICLSSNRYQFLHSRRSLFTQKTEQNHTLIIHHHLLQLHCHLRKNSQTMSDEFSPPPTSKFSNRLLSDLYLLLSFILSHPIYFFYFIFFSPYIIKICSFLSPLFITTFLLLLALFTTHTSLVNRLLEGDRHSEEQFHQAAYKIVFDEPTVEVHSYLQSSLSDPPVDKYPSHESSVSEDGQVCGDHEIEISVSADCIDKSSVSDDGQFNSNLIVEVFGDCIDKISVTSDPVTECSVSDPVKISGNIRVNESLAEIMLKEVERDSDDVYLGEKEVKEANTESNKVKEVEEVESLTKRASKEGKVRSSSEVKEGKVRSMSQRVGSDYYYKNSSSLGSFGSMRREKEWKRTLACKLFEERHNVNVDGGIEGMDLLWETYETDNSNKVAVSKSKSKKGKADVDVDVDYEDDDDDDELDSEGQLCCLQALKFSTGKMNLGMGMGRPNLMKFTKAIKGFGWLHKHGNKKVHP